MVVIDATVAVTASLTPDGFDDLAREELVAPPLMWSEGRSSLHEALWRGDLDAAEAHEAHGRLQGAPVRVVSENRLGDESWRIANELGWAKTYDAEYVALASILGCRLVTLDARLRRGVDRLGFVVTPTEL